MATSKERGEAFIRRTIRKILYTGRSGWYRSRYQIPVSVLTPVFQGFVKVVKNKAYFKRYEVKFRRRRGKQEHLF